MALLPTIASEWLSEHKPVVSLTAITVVLFVVAKALDVAGGPAGLNKATGLDVVGGLLGAFGVLVLATTIVVAAFDVVF